MTWCECEQHAVHLDQKNAVRNALPAGRQTPEQWGKIGIEEELGFRNVLHLSDAPEKPALDTTSLKTSGFVSSYAGLEAGACSLLLSK